MFCNGLIGVNLRINFWFVCLKRCFECQCDIAFLDIILYSNYENSKTKKVSQLS
jgi:hypothetical protein